MTMNWKFVVVVEGDQDVVVGSLVVDSVFPCGCIDECIMELAVVVEGDQDVVVGSLVVDSVLLWMWL